MYSAVTCYSLGLRRHGLKIQAEQIQLAEEQPSFNDIRIENSNIQETAF